MFGGACVKNKIHSLLKKLFSQFLCNEKHGSLMIVTTMLILRYQLKMVNYWANF